MSEIEKISDDQIQRRIDFYAARSISPKSRSAYEKDWAGFVAWCLSRDIVEVLPASPSTVAAYFTYLADNGSRVSTIARKSTSISVIHASLDLPSPVRTSEVGRVLKGIRRTVGTDTQKARALSWDEIKRMVRNCDPSIIGKRDAAILLLGWTSALRRSELVALNFGDIQFVEEGLLLRIKKSKTDQEGHGQTIGIPRGEKPFCPVAAVEEWMDRCFEKKDVEPDKPIFCNLGIATRKLFWAPGKGRISEKMISLIVKRYAELAGFKKANISAHSLRRGFATEAGSHRIPERLIMRHTRHRSIEVLRGYIEDGSIWRENPLYYIYGANQHHIMSSKAAL